MRIPWRTVGEFCTPTLKGLGLIRIRGESIVNVAHEHFNNETRKWEWQVHSRVGCIARPVEPTDLYFDLGDLGDTDGA